jgi:hypothetical protein
MGGDSMSDIDIINLFKCRPYAVFTSANRSASPATFFCLKSAENFAIKHANMELFHISGRRMKIRGIAGVNFEQWRAGPEVKL